MKETIDVLYIYNLVDANGAKLQLRLGRIKGYGDELRGYNTDHGYRWSFIGTKIPMPVRNGTWFNGFPVDTMLEWLKGNGWYLHTRVTMHNGKVHVFELPDVFPKGNETTPMCKAPDYILEAGKVVFNDVIRRLCANGERIAAIKLFRYVHPCSLAEANQAVIAIRDAEM